MLVKIQCANCGHDFTADTQTYDNLKIDHLPRKCPTCYDRIQKRPEHAIVTSRECLKEWPAILIAQFPRHSFQEFKPDPTRQAALRTVLHAPGSGAAHDGGRMDVYAIGMGTDPRAIPDVVRVRWMKATHAAPPPALEQKHGPPRQFSPTWEYVVFERTEDIPDAALVFLSAHSKTTLKGFGRQYASVLDANGARDIIHWWSRWAKSTGRFSTDSVLAIVDDAHPIYIRSVGLGEGQDVRVFNFSHPHGCAPQDLAEVTE